jgi:superfamily II DNA or RNA helicase
MMIYEDFLLKKQVNDVYGGFAVDALNPHLFDFQRAIVEWALKKGRAAVFADTGLGKTLTQLSWADAVANHAGRVLIVAPLCVAQQTVDEGRKFGVHVEYRRHQSEIKGDDRIVITNYEMLEHFDASMFAGVVLDESSILKGEDSKTRRELIAKFSETSYRLSCTATPSPNDYMELGSQSEFLGVMRHAEMLAMFFTHDGGDTSKWRLKGHGKTKFWEWLATWAAFIRNPADLGFDGSRYNLPPMRLVEHRIEVNDPVANTMTERRIARKNSVLMRCATLADVVNNSNEHWVIWCNLNEESSMLASMIPDAIEVYGSQSPTIKENLLHKFSRGEARVIVSKPKICGFGLNWQHCRNVAFVGIDDSFEKYYQAIRRCYRFGQSREVNVHLVYSSAEGAVKENLERKQQMADIMADQMVNHMREFTKREVMGTRMERTEYNPNQRINLPEWI